MLGLRTKLPSALTMLTPGSDCQASRSGKPSSSFEERPLALVMDGEVDLGVGPQEGLGLVRHVRAAEDDDDARP